MDHSISNILHFLRLPGHSLASARWLATVVEQILTLHLADESGTCTVQPSELGAHLRYIVHAKGTWNFITEAAEEGGVGSGSNAERVFGHEGLRERCDSTPQPLLFREGFIFAQQIQQWQLACCIGYPPPLCNFTLDKVHCLRHSVFCLRVAFR